MFPISVYTGGAMLDGQYGVSCSVPSTVSFPAKEEISFDELKVELYRWLALSPARDTLKIRVRFNAAKPPNAYFSEIQVLNNEMCRLIVENSICAGNWNMLQLYVDAVPISSQPSNVPNSTSAGGGAHVDAGCSDPQADPASQPSNVPNSMSAGGGAHVDAGCSDPQADPVSNRRDSPVADCYESVDPRLSGPYSFTACISRRMTIISGNDGDEGEEEDDLLENHKKRQRKNESSEAADVPTEKEKEADPSLKPRKFLYPCSELFQFETLRDRNKVAVGQVWAIYDDCDGMPRFYAHIKSLQTAPKILIHSVWLEADPDKSTLAWHRAGLPIATGKFRIGSSAQTVHDLLTFSHIVSCGKSSKGNSFERYPRKGEVWAMFKDWDRSWSSKSGKPRKFEYEMVEVVSDVTDSTGFVVMPLVKINGFVSLFMQSTEAAPVVIPASEILRFSHSVPLYRVTGNERNGVPEGAFELDPAFLPHDLDSSCSFNNLDPKPIQKPITNPSSEHKGEKKEDRKNHGRGKEVDVVEISSTKAHDHEFYSFSDARSIENVERGQIWALYSEIDTLPKYYAMVKQIDVENARVLIKWLEPYGESVFGVEKSQIKHAFPFGCGVYRLANGVGDWYEIDAFSHQMAAIPGAGKNGYEIKPAKTETWAVYRNWHCGWSTDDIKECQYDLVRISEVNQAGITVLFLVKVVGYKAVFRLDGRRKPMEIPNGELKKFSHKIPAHQVTHQVDGTISDCWELDTAALPETLLC